MSEQKQYARPSLIYSLSVPLAILYTALLWYTKTSMVLAALGYVTLGFSFGCFQSIFSTRQPYRVAFFSSALGPLMAYLFAAFIGLLVALGIVVGAIPDADFDSGGVIPFHSAPYIERLGMAGGIILFLIVIAFLIIPFGLIGIAGRFVGESLLLRISRSNLSRQRSLSSTRSVESNQKDFELQRLTSITAIVVAGISAVASIIVALIG